ncbi:MAG TPA: Dabb family protein [Actinocrinis sp.]|nr:Dabb family protein [Actinocrinis sp.]
MALRNTLFVRLKPGTTDDQVEAFRSALEALEFPGRSNFVFGRDLGLREDNMDLGWSNDFEDEQVYKAWAVDPDHQRVRDDFLAPIAERIERCLIRL